MLKPLLAGLLALLFIDYAPFALAFAAGAFFWDWRVPGPDASEITAMKGADYWVWWVQAVAGAAFAVLLKAWTGRPLLRLWPRSAEGASSLYQGFMVAVIAFLALFLYRLRIDDPADALVEPFPIGVLFSMLGLCCALFAAELVEYYLGKAAPPVLLTLRSSRNLLAAYAGVGVMTLDLLAFQGAHLLALFGVALMCVIFVLGGMLSRAHTTIRGRE